ncbi:hypothetical protein ACEQ8H_003005 [Pleosporales sp. CAS-2024a]
MAVDATHARNLVSGMVVEGVARRLNLPIPYNRSWSRSETTLRKMLESAGLEVDSVSTIDNQAGYGRRDYDVAGVALSGSAYLPFISLARRAWTVEEECSSLKTLKLSDVAERRFCEKCGTRITMAYSFDEECISVTMGSIDTSSFTCDAPRVKRHIDLREKAGWVVVPEDGTERWGMSPVAHLIEPKHR